MSDEIKTDPPRVALASSSSRATPSGVPVLYIKQGTSNWSEWSSVFSCWLDSEDLSWVHNGEGMPARTSTTKIGRAQYLISAVISPVLRNIIQDREISIEPMTPIEKWDFLKNRCLCVMQAAIDLLRTKLTSVKDRMKSAHISHVSNPNHVGQADHMEKYLDDMLTIFLQLGQSGEIISPRERVREIITPLSSTHWGTIYSSF